MKKSVCVAVRSLTVLVLVAVAAHWPRYSIAADVFWDLSAGGDWHTATNWSNDLVPGADDNVTIDRLGDLTITLQSPASVHQLISQESIVLNQILTLGVDSEIHGSLIVGGIFGASPGLAGAGNLAIDGALVWNGGSIGGAGKITLSAASTTIIAPGTAGQAPTLSRTIENAGLVNFTPPLGNSLTFVGGTFKNMPTGTFNVISTTAFNLNGSGVQNVFENAGTFNKTGSANFTCAPTFANTGTVNIYDGQVTMNSGNNTGTINMALGAGLSLSSNFTNSGTINITEFFTPIAVSTFVPGGMTNASTGRINVLAGTVRMGTALNNSGEIHIAAGASMEMGGVNSPAGSKITGPGDLSFSSSGANFAGSIEATGSIWISGNSVAWNSNQTIAGDLVLTTGSLTGSGNIHITKPFTWSSGTMAGTGKTTIAEGAVALIGTGPTSTNSGPMTLSRVLENAGTVNYAPTSTSGLTFSSGTFKNLSTGVFNASPSTNVSISFDFNSLLDNAGTFNKLDGLALTCNVPVANSGTVNVQGGTLNLTAGTNTGTINMLIGTQLGLGSGFTNSGTINLYEQNGPLPTGSFNPGNSTNGATGRINLLEGNLSITSLFNQAGEIHVAQAATMNYGGANVLAGSKFTGPGNITFSQGVNNFLGSLDVTGSIYLPVQMTFNANQAINGNLLLTHTLTGTGNININGLFTWAAGAMTGSGKTTIGAGALATFGPSKLTPSSGTVSLSRVLDNAGTVNLSRIGSAGVTLSFASGGVFNNLAGGTFNIVQDQFSGAITGTGTINNAGTMNVSPGAGPFNLNSVVVNNSGVLNVFSGGLTGSINNTGVMNLYSGGGGASTNSGTINYFSSGIGGVGTNTGLVRVYAGNVSMPGARGLGGEIHVAAGAVAALNGSTGVLSQNATFKTTGPGDIVLSSFTTAPLAGMLLNTGNVTINDTVNIQTDQNIAGTLVVGPQPGGTLGGAGNILVSNRFTWGLGTLTGPGRLTIGPIAVAELSNLSSTARNLQRTFENAGQTTFVPGTSTTNFSGGTLINLPTGVITISDATSTNWSGSGSGNSISNQGLIRLIDNPGFTVTNIPVTNSGTIDVAAGTAQLSGGYTHAGGRLVLGGGTIAIASSFTLQGGSIEGRGSMLGGANTSNGTIAPEGQLTVSLIAFAAGAKTEFELGGTTLGTQYDTLVAFGSSLTYGGRLLVDFKDGFESAILPTDSFRVISVSGQALGAFDNVLNGQRLLTADRSGSFVVHYGAASTLNPQHVILSDFLPYVPGDFDSDGDVDGADFVAWQTNFPLASGASLAEGDADGDGDVDGADFVVWQASFPSSPTPDAATVPEPASGTLAALMAILLIGSIINSRRGRPTAILATRR